MYKPSRRTITITQPEPSLVIKVILTSGGAKLPRKVKNAPNTQTLSLIKRKGVEEDEVGKVTVFEVGLYFITPPRIQLQLIASPSLIAHGYMVSSGVMAVPDKKTFTIQLFKFREGPDLELPYEGIYLTALQSPSIYYQRSLPIKKPIPSTFNITPEMDSSHSFDDFNQQDINTLS